MNLQKMIGELQAEKDRLDAAILALERLSVPHAKRRERPPLGAKEAMPVSLQERTSDEVDRPGDA